MVSFERSPLRPELSVRLSGRVSMADVTDAAGAFESALERMRPGFVLVVEYPELRTFEPEAQGVLFYLARRVFQADPLAVVLVGGAGAVPSPALRELARHLDPGQRTRTFTTRQEADAFLRARPVDGVS